MTHSTSADSSAHLISDNHWETSTWCYFSCPSQLSNCFLCKAFCNPLQPQVPPSVYDLCLYDAISVIIDECSFSLGSCCSYSRFICGSLNKSHSLVLWKTVWHHIIAPFSWELKLNQEQPRTGRPQPSPVAFRTVCHFPNTLIHYVQCIYMAD